MTRDYAITNVIRISSLKELTCEAEPEAALSETVGVGTVQATDVELDTPNGPEAPLEVSYIEPPTRPPPVTSTAKVRWLDSPYKIA